MSRILWLAFERFPHPDAVAHPAVEDDVRRALEWLELPAAERNRYAEQFRNFVRAERERGTFDRSAVPCRRPSGLIVLMPWRLAKWLSLVLTASDGVVAKTAARLRAWLSHDLAVPFINAAPRGPSAS